MPHSPRPENGELVDRDSHVVSTDSLVAPAVNADSPFEGSELQVQVERHF